MCEVLVKWVDRVHPTDTVKDRRGCYKKGDPAAVMPDGHEWGRKERLPIFVVVKIPGVNARDLAETLLGPEYDGDKMVLAIDPAGVPYVTDERLRLTRCRCFFNRAGLAARQRTDLDRDGEITLTRSEAEPRFIDKVDGLRAIDGRVR